MGILVGVLVEAAVAVVAVAPDLPMGEAVVVPTELNLTTLRVVTAGPVAAGAALAQDQDQDRDQDRVQAMEELAVMFQEQSLPPRITVPWTNRRPVGNRVKQGVQLQEEVPQLTGRLLLQLMVAHHPLLVLHLLRVALHL